MKRFLILALLGLISSCGNQNPNPNCPDCSAEKTRADSLQLLLDSLQAPADTPTQTITEPAPAPAEQPAAKPPAKPGDGFVGRHRLTLQWISWDVPGSVNISAADASGWHPIKGEQTKRNSSDYLRINGRIRKVSDLELEFEGTITSQVESVNQGKPCVREGRQKFLSTRGRQYWRLQNMINCEGGLVTDYVDIYFK